MPLAQYLLLQWRPFYLVSSCGEPARRITTLKDRLTSSGLALAPSHGRRIVAQSTIVISISNYSLLAIAQRNRLDFMHIQWETGEAALLGLGATGRVDQACIDIRSSLAFKRYKRRRAPVVHGAEGSGEDDEHGLKGKGKAKDDNVDSELFLAWSMEIAVLRSPTIAAHPGIIDLEGLAWDMHRREGGESTSVLPALVYMKADLDTLLMFLETRAGRLTLAEKLAICLDLSVALATVHSCGTGGTACGYRGL